MIFLDLEIENILQHLDEDARYSLFLIDLKNKGTVFDILPNFSL